MPNSQKKRGKGSYLREQSRERGRERGSFTGTVLQRQVEGKGQAKHR
jgi:stalled ribosome alternative rescue factor ArfA